MFSLEGRVIVLTGAAGHLGSAMSEAMLKAGAELVITGRRIEALEAFRSQLESSLRQRCHILAGDITKEEGIREVRQTVEARFQRLHGLVNNAYGGRVGTMDTIIKEDFHVACEYNLVAPFLLINALLPLLLNSVQETGNTASIVNVASMYGSVSPDPALYADSGKNNPVHYGATKAGLIQMTRYLACHLGASGIRVNSIAPGPFPNTSADPGIPGFFERLTDRVPMKRLGKPQDVGGPVVFLLSDAAAYINGVNLPIDGGWTAW